VTDKRHARRCTRKIVWSFPDPSRASGTDDEKLAVFRQVRDAIRARLQEWRRGL